MGVGVSEPMDKGFLSLSSISTPSAFLPSFLKIHTSLTREPVHKLCFYRVFSPSRNKNLNQKTFSG